MVSGVRIQLPGVSVLTAHMKLHFKSWNWFLTWASLHFVGWVELTPGFVGFRSTQPNLHVAGVFAKCETQQRPISEPSPKSFFFDQTGCFFAGGGAEP